MKKIIICLLFIAIIQFVIIESYNPNQFTPSNWIISQNTVYIDDSKAFISATPHTISGSDWVVFNITPKQFTGDIDIGLGFDTTQLRPKKIQLYDPTIVTNNRSYTCEHNFNYTVSPKYFWCFDNTTYDKTIIYFEHSFDSGNVQTKTAYWNENSLDEWKDIPSNIFDSVNYTVNDINKWWFKKNVAVTAGQTYVFRVFLENNNANHKYWFVLKPSSETIQQAIDNNHFYALDPWTASLSTSLIAYYKLDEPSGTNVTDSRGYYHGYNDQVTVNAAGKVGTAYRSQTFNDSVGITKAIGDDLSSGAVGMSVNFWLNITDTLTNNQGIFQFGNRTGSLGVFNFAYITNNLSAFGTNLYQYNSYQNAWKMITITFNGTTMQTFVDGTSVKNITQDTPNFTGENLSFFEYYDKSGTYWMRGSIDEFGIWNKTLSNQDISDLWNGGSGLTYDNFIVNITYPSNLTYTTLISSLNYTQVGGSYCWYSTDDGASNSSAVTAGNNFSISSVSGSNTWIVFCNNSGGSSIINDRETFTVTTLNETGRNFSNFTYETQTDTLTLNLSMNSSLTHVYLNYSGTIYPTTKSGEQWSYSKALNSTDVGNRTLNWIATYIGVNYSTSYSYQYVNNVTLQICDVGIYNKTYLNISFKDETNLSVIKAAVPSASFTYYTGNGGWNKTYVFSNTTTNYQYRFCAYPSNLTYYMNYSLQYSDTDYPQRAFSPPFSSYTNSSLNQTLYSLNSGSGRYVTFQVQGIAGQALSGVTVNVTRTISGSLVIVGTGTTGSDGAVEFWLSPDNQHTINFSKEGYESITYNIYPTQSGYTIVLGSTSSSIANDYLRGMNLYTYPTTKELTNDTTYRFIFNLTSSYWDVSSFGFRLRLADGTIVDSASSSTEGIGAFYNYDVNNETIIYMDYYWVINSTYTNRTTYWIITNSLNNEWSIKTFFTDLNTYLDSGIFGLDTFGRYVLAFLFLFITVGVLGYKYGINNPLFMSSLTFAIVFFLDVVTGLIPPIRGINHLATYLAGLMLTIIVIGEVTR